MRSPQPWATAWYPPCRSRPNWITGPGPKSEPAGKSESRGPENGVSRWRWLNSDIYSQNHHFGLVYDMIYQFLGMEAKNYKFGMFCQQCHPSVASGDADIRLPDSHLPFVYVVILSISPIWRIGETNPSTKTFKILFSLVMPTSGKVVAGLDCTASKTKAKLDPQANFPRWRPLDRHADAGREAHQQICQFLIAEICSIFLNQVC